MSSRLKKGGGGRTRRPCPTGSILSPPQRPRQRESVHGEDGRRVFAFGACPPYITGLPSLREGIVVRTDPSASVGMTNLECVPVRLRSGQACPTKNGRQTGRLSHQERRRPTGWEPVLPRTAGGDRCPRPTVRPRLQAEACGTRNGRAIRGLARMGRGRNAAPTKRITAWAGDEAPALRGTATVGRTAVRPYCTANG